MEVYSNKERLKQQISTLKQKSFKIGFVPTMGALHKGHLSLVKKALINNDAVVVSIFVNPTQFDNKSDLNNYPRTLESDIELLKALSGVLLIYAPEITDLYTTVISDSFNFDGLENQMEGRFRAGHFNGVGTVVKRLFEIVEPDTAYFGEKDYQQLVIIKKLVEKLKLNIDVQGCKINREPDGLAMSSRNKRLTDAYRMAAPFLYKTLKDAKHRFGTESAKTITEWVEAQFKAHPLLKLEYFTIANETTLKPVSRKVKNKKYRGFIAVYAGEIRLIDNIALN